MRRISMWMGVFALALMRTLGGAGPAMSAPIESAGCQFVNQYAAVPHLYNNFSPSTLLQFFAGERLTITAGPPIDSSSSTPTEVYIWFNWYPVATTSFPGSVSYTIPDSSTSLIQMGVNTGNVQIRLACAPRTVSAPVFPVQVNFQPANAPIPAGYLADVGAPYAPRPNGYTYGWGSENGPNTRDRNAPNSPDQRYDTFIHTQLTGRASWQIEVPNGRYTVHLVCGDPLYYNSFYRVTAEGVLIVDGVPTPQQPWVEGTVTVTVADNKLSIITASGAINNKLAFIEIRQAP